VAADPDGGSFHDPDRSGLPKWIQKYPYALQPLPTIVADSKLREVRRATTELSRIVKNVPFSVFGGDPKKVADYYGLESPDWAEVILGEPNGVAGALTRGDFLDTDRGFQCVEYNMSAYLGGWQIRFFAAGLTSSPLLADTLRRNRRSARFIDPLEVLFAHVVERALDLESCVEDRVNLYLLIGERDTGTGIRELFESLAGDYARALEREFPWMSGRLFVGWPERLARGAQGFTMDGERVHSVIEYNDQISDPELLRAMKDRLVDLYNGMAGQVIGDKRNLALLSEHQETADLSEADRELVRRHIPWTRRTDIEETTFEGERVTFPSFLARARERLVLKSARGSRGQDVFVGGETETAVWEDVVHQASVSSDWIVQEFVPSRQYWYFGPDRELCSHSVVWGTFAFGSHYGGGFLRMVPTGKGSIINSARGASEGLILEIDDE
jgi:hypothetical protein